GLPRRGARRPGARPRVPHEGRSVRRGPDPDVDRVQARERGRPGAAAPASGGVLAVLRLLIRRLEAEDWEAVAAIYEARIASRNATFETGVPGWAAWDAGHLREHRLVAERDGRVVGWAALSPVSARRCYAGVTEDSVYVASDAQGRGVGRALLERLVAGSE